MQIEHIILESSPFIRTMMTAAAIARGLGIDKIAINYLFSEKMGESMFD